jgi:hypothetical protein
MGKEVTKMSRDKVYEMLDMTGRNRLLVCHTNLGDWVTIGRRGEYYYETDGTLHKQEEIKSFLGEMRAHCEIV